MTNIRLKGGKEIDILAVPPPNGGKLYHIEARVAPMFKLKTIDTKTKGGKHPGTRHKRGLDYFYDEKFNHPMVIESIESIFRTKGYRRILVVWGVEGPRVWQKAKRLGIDIWLMPKLIEELTNTIKGRGYRDDVLRTLELTKLATATNR